MFRNSRCTIERPTTEKVDGEIFWNNKTVAKDIPCHFSVRVLSAVDQTDSVAKIYYDFTLFTDNTSGVEILPNDIIYATRNGKTYKLKAGVSIPYTLTTQTRCEVLDIVDEVV